ncbi:MAG: hypothetical protein KGZ39_01310 [Simkania sp.]|nr:hypothetical protein [Simkania sp.]
MSLSDGLSDPLKGATSSNSIPPPTQEGILPTDEKLASLMKTKGYLTLRGGELTVTDNLVEAKKTHAEVKSYLNDLDQRVNQKVLFQLALRFSDDMLKATFGPMPSADLTKLLSEHLQDHGLSSTLYLLDSICEEKMGAQHRFNTVSPWPEQRKTPFLHLFPNVGTGSPNPIPKGGPVKLIAVMEPSLEPTRTINGKQVSNAELLLTDLSALEEMIKDLPPTEQATIRKEKHELDAYYKHKASVSLSLENKEFLITVPTTRYAPRQFLAMSVTGREDVQKMAEEKKRAQVERSSETSMLSRSKTLPSPPPLRLGEEEKTSILKKAIESDRPGLIRENTSDIRSMANLIQEMPPGSFIGQNSPDTSTDATYQHFQMFLDPPTHLVPLFSAPDQPVATGTYLDQQGHSQSIQCSRVSEFQGSIYRITTSSNDAASRTFLESIQNHFLSADNNRSSINLISRKVSDTQYEHYFVLRKSIAEDAHPDLQRAAQAKGSTRPGWFEMTGVRLGKTEADFEKLPDEIYRKEIVETFTVNPRECTLFEGIIQSSLLVLFS